MARAATGRLQGVSARLEPLQTILQGCEAFGLRRCLSEKQAICLHWRTRNGAGRPGWHAKAEHCRSIDARRGLGWTDPDTGEHLASIGYSVSPEALALIYTMNGEPMRQHVPILAVCTGELMTD